MNVIVNLSCLAPGVEVIKKEEIVKKDPIIEMEELKKKKEQEEQEELKRLVEERLKNLKEESQVRDEL